MEGDQVANQPHTAKVRTSPVSGLPAAPLLPLFLERVDDHVVVQAKHWRRDAVGVALVRELYGVQRAMGADGAMFVSLGRYTVDARQFAGSVGTTLVDGDELLAIIHAGLGDGTVVVPSSAAAVIPRMPRLRRGNGVAEGATRAARRRGLLGVFDVPRVPGDDEHNAGGCRSPIEKGCSRRRGSETLRSLS